MNVKSQRAVVAVFTSTVAEKESGVGVIVDVGVIDGVTETLGAISVVGATEGVTLSVGTTTPPPPLLKIPETKRISPVTNKIKKNIKSVIKRNVLLFGLVGKASSLIVSVTGVPAAGFST